ncbi:helix-turn-helix domain-containing protein [Kitasatospora sp. NPDC093550]|uniref:helix-turn-helix domain-containing protein n=1 Tax=Kitasatospora sp. NPDC093550 TaxID=3364089 RepID=UPI00382AD81C
MSTGAGGARGDDDMSAQDRFEQWREVIGRTRECEATSAHAADFTGQVRRVELGPVALFGSSFQSARFRRDERMVRRSDAELYHLTLLTSGCQEIGRGADQRETFRPGDLSFIDSSHPYDSLVYGVGRAGRGEPRVGGVGVDLPAALLPVRPQQLRDLLGRRLSRREGPGALLGEFLLGLDRQAPNLRPADGPRLGAVLVDLVAAWLARELDAETALPSETRRRVLVENVRAFIRQNLHDPDLTPATVAAAHHVSVSYLHRLFTQEARGETVAAAIRAQRLRKAHRELADPALRAVPIHAVAARCGIPRAAEFSRAFKNAYGLPPREHRHRALAEPGGG